MEEKRSQNKVAMHYGAMYGLASVVVGLIFYFAGADLQSKAPQWIGYILMIAILYMGIKNYRDQDLQGFIGYGHSLGTGVLIGLYGGIIIGFYTVLLFKYIDPDLVVKILERAEEDMLASGTPESQVEVAMEWTKKFMNPGMLFVFSVLGSAFMAMLFSLVISAFLKKEQKPF